MNRQHDGLATSQVPVHPLDHVGKHIGRRPFDRGRQVDDAFALQRGLPHVGDRVDHALGEVELGVGKHLGRILEAPVCLWLLGGELVHQLRMLDGQRDHAVFVHAQHHLAHHRRRGVVEVNDGLLGALQRFERAPDQGFSSLGEHLDGHIVRHEVLLDQHANEIELGLRSRREADLDLLEADAQKHLEHAQLALRIHGLDQRLVAIAQIGAEPDRSARQHGIGPGAVTQGDRGERSVLQVRLLQHGEPRKSRITTSTLDKAKRPDAGCIRAVESENE
jgi:hypothetical protein